MSNRSLLFSHDGFAQVTVARICFLAIFLAVSSIGLKSAAIAVCLLQDGVAVAADELELMDGQKLRGTILEIRKDQKTILVQLINDTEKNFDYSEIHAVTYRGKRFVITPMKATESSLTDSDRSAADRKTKADILQSIEVSGNSIPDWFESTVMKYPETLDLDWPLNASGGWDSQKNVGQFLWDVVYPNEGRWKSGIKLVHHCVQLHRDDPALLKRDMETLGNMYFVLLQDYERAAFWYQKISSIRSPVVKVRLAECYWRLGNLSMALALLDDGRLPVEGIKLYGDMKRLDDVVRLVDGMSESSRNNEAWLAAGDAFRSAGELDKATEYYQKVLDNNQARNEEYKQRFHSLAKGGIESIQFLAKCKPAEIADGTFAGKSIGYNGQLELAVTIAAGKITAVTVTKHREKQFYAALTDTPNRIIESQSVEGIDGTSGATITSQAIIHATSKALANAPRK